MKKRIILSIGVLAIAVVVSLNINLAKTDSSSLAFMNIQALAGETGGSEPGSGESGPATIASRATESTLETTTVLEHSGGQCVIVHLACVHNNCIGIGPLQCLAGTRCNPIAFENVECK